VVGALATAILFNFGKFLISLYIGSSRVATTYGAAGALAVILLWIYYSAQIFLFGAEFAKAYAGLRGGPASETADPAASARSMMGQVSSTDSAAPP
jgi:membrane protein